MQIDRVRLRGQFCGIVQDKGDDYALIINVTAESSEDVVIKEVRTKIKRGKCRLIAGEEIIFSATVKLTNGVLTLRNVELPKARSKKSEKKLSPEEMLSNSGWPEYVIAIARQQIADGISVASDPGRWQEACDDLHAAMLKSVGLTEVQLTKAKPVAQRWDFHRQKGLFDE